MDKVTYRGVPVSDITIMYDALVRKGINLESDASKAFVQGFKYGSELVHQRCKDTIKRVIKAL